MKDRQQDLGIGKGNRRNTGNERQHPINRLKQELSDNDISGAQKTLGRLNKRLTGSNSVDFYPTKEGRQALRGKLEEFQQEYREYGIAKQHVNLGDGGYSRIVLSKKDDKVDVYISPVSTPEVITLWERLTKQADKKKK